MNEFFAGMYFFFCNIPQSQLLYRVQLAQLSLKFCSGHTAIYRPSWYSLKLCDGLTGPRNVLRILIFLPAAVVAIKLLYGGSCAVIAKILQWLYMATWFLRKFSGTWPYRAIVLRIPIFFFWLQRWP